MTNEELQADNEELKDMVKDYEELLESKKEASLCKKNIYENNGIKIKFESIKNVNNPNSIHGIYPYRGKISAIDAQQLISQLPKKGVLLDPFCGSGTIVYEAQRHGIKSIGVDLNPLAVDIAKGKIYLGAKDDVINEASKIIELAKKLKKSPKMPSDALKHFHADTAEEIMRVSVFVDKMSDYIKASFYGAIALSARGCNWYKWTSSSVGKDINPKQKIDFYKKYFDKTKKHFHPTEHNGSKIFLHDSKKISEIVKSNSIDYIFTSPPYFDCLDYTAYYGKIVYSIFGSDRLKIKQHLIQHYKDYQEDMRDVLNDLYKVCKKNATIIFVVGDKKIHGKIINGAEFFNDISPFKTCHVIERSYAGSSSQVFDKLNNTKRKEQIIIWNK